MKMNYRERKELAASKLVIIAFAVVGVAITVWFAWIWPALHAKPVASYATCVTAGNPVEESYPSVCVAHSGKRYINPNEKAQQQSAARKTQPASAQTVSKMTYSQVPPALQQVIFAYTKDNAPACIKDGVIVDYNGMPTDQAVAYQADNYAITAIGCDGSSNAFFAKDKAGNWQVLERTQFGFSCSIIAGTGAIKDLFLAAGSKGTCYDISGRSHDIAGLHE